MIAEPTGYPMAVDRNDPPPPTPTAMLAARFLLELFGLVGFGVWGWATGEGGLRGGTLAAILVIAAAAV